jgi:hypothetical protein
MRTKPSPEYIAEVSEKVKKHVTLEFNIDLNSKSRKMEYVDARSIYYKILYDYYKLTYEEIAETVDKNHASIINATSNFKYYIEQDSIKKEKYIKILLSLDLISQSEVELMSISDKNTKISKLYKLVRRVPEDKIDFFYEKIHTLLECF